MDDLGFFFGVLSLLLRGVCASLVYVLAERKGRGKVEWVLFALLVPLIALVAISLLPAVRPGCRHCGNTEQRIGNFCSVCGQPQP